MSKRNYFDNLNKGDLIFHGNAGPILYLTNNSGYYWFLGANDNKLKIYTMGDLVRNAKR